MPLDLFSKTPIPSTLPKEMQAIVNELKKTPGKEACLKKAYEILTSRYRGYRIKTYTKLFAVFHKNIETLWNKQGFLHCTNMNYLLRTLLIKSDFFTEDDLRLHWTQIWYLSPHQYVQVRINGEWINVDIWAHTYKISFGDYAHGFHSGDF